MMCKWCRRRVHDGSKDGEVLVGHGDAASDKHGGRGRLRGGERHEQMHCEPHVQKPGEVVHLNQYQSFSWGFNPTASLEKFTCTFTAPHKPNTTIDVYSSNAYWQNPSCNCRTGGKCTSGDSGATNRLCALGGVNSNQLVMLLPQNLKSLSLCLCLCSCMLYRNR